MKSPLPHFLSSFHPNLFFCHKHKDEIKTLSNKKALVWVKMRERFYTSLWGAVFHGSTNLLLFSWLAKSHVLIGIPNLCYRCDNRRNKMENVCVLVAEPPLQPWSISKWHLIELTPFADPCEEILNPCFGCEEAGRINIMIGRALNILIGQVLLALALHRRGTE